MRDEQAHERDLTPPKAPLPPDQVRERIVAGQFRRKQMKKGVFRRCLGNVKQIMMAMCLMTATGIGTAASHTYGRLYSQRPDVLEVFSGSAEISHRFARWAGLRWSPLMKFMELILEKKTIVGNFWIGSVNIVLGWSLWRFLVSGGHL